MINRVLNSLLAFVMIISFILSVFLISSMLQSRHQLTDRKTALAESYQNWNTTAELKENLLDDLSLINEQIKESELSFEESGSKVSRRLEEIEELEQELVSLSAD